MITALLVATRDTIRHQLKFDSSNCIIQDDGMPPPTCGPIFVAIYGSSWSPDLLDQNLGIDERGDIALTITRRALATAFDIRGEEIYVRDSLEVERTANTIKRLIHQNYDLITLANTYLDGDDKIIEPLRWLGNDPQPSRVSSSWFSSEDENPFAGITFTMRFGRARRMQTNLTIR